MKKCKLITSALALLVIATLAMPTFAAERDTPRIEFPVATLTAGGTITAGYVIGQTGGYGYVYTSTTTNLTVIGIAQNSAVSNETVYVRGGIFGLKNSGTVTASYIGASGYAYTNNTGYTVAPSGLAKIGTIVAVDSDYVWTRVGP